MHRHRPAALAAALILPVAVLIAGCAEPETTPEAQGPEVATVVVDVPDASADELNAAAEVVRARVMALDLEVGEVGWDDTSIEVIVPAADEDLVRAALAPIGELEIRPVLQFVDPATAPTATTTPLAQRSPDAVVTASSQEGDVYLLGPAELGTAAIESATSSAAPDGQWTVDPLFRAGSDGIDAFNALAAACFSGAQTCPAISAGGQGSVAILLDGVVLVAPTINTDRFERDQIRISGAFDETSAGALAAALDGGEANVPWTVRD